MSERTAAARRPLGPKSVFIGGRLRYADTGRGRARTLRTLFGRWRDLPLVLQFVTAGGAVMLAAMLVIGSWITARIQQSVVDNTATAAALYLESFVSPLSQELAADDTLSEPARRALAGGLRRHRHRRAHRVLQDLEAGRPRRARLGPGDRRRALSAHRGAPPRLGAARSAAASSASTTPRAPPRRRSALPLLEVYSPIREVWSGEVIAVAEFYEVAAELQRDLAGARRDELAAGGGRVPRERPDALGIVRAGGRTIARQAAALQAQVAESRGIAAQNRELRDRAVDASARAAAADRAHPAPGRRRPARRAGAVRGAGRHAARQPRARHRGRPRARPRRVRAALQTGARRDPRDLARALAARARRAEPARGRRAARSRRTCGHAEADGRRSTTRARRTPAIDASAADLPLPLPAGGAVERVAPRPRGRGRASRCAVDADRADRDGPRRRPGLRPAAAGIRVGRTAAQGLAGLRDRAESIGGELEHRDARPGAGTTLVLTLPLGKGETDMSIRVVLADDHPIFRDGLVRSLEESGGFEVVGAGGSADEAVALVERHRPDLALLDISMPGGGIEAARRIARAAPGDPHRDADGVRGRPGRRRRAAGRRDRLRAEGGLGGASSPASSRASPRGEAHVSPALAARVLGDMQRPRRQAAPQPIDDLTRREEDILRRVARGHEQPRGRRGARDPGEDGQALHDLDPGEAARPQPGRGGADRPRRLEGR